MTVIDLKQDADLFGSTVTAVSAEGLADMLGLTVRSVTNLANEGLVKRIGHGKYDLVQSIRLYTAHLREMAAGRGDGNGLDLVAERARLAKEQADAQSLKNQKDRLELIPAVEVEQEWTNVLRSVRSAILALPTRVRQSLPHLVQSDVQAIDREVRTMLEDMANAE